MSDALELAVELVRSHGIPRIPEGVDRGLDSAIDHAAEWLEGEDLAGLAPAARDGVEELRAVAPHAGRLVGGQVGALLSRAFRGTLDELDDVEARRAAFASALTFEERLEAQLAGSLAVLEEALLDEAAWDAVKDTLKSIGQDLLKAAIPVLLAAL